MVYTLKGEAVNEYSGYINENFNLLPFKGKEDCIAREHEIQYKLIISI